MSCINQMTISHTGDTNFTFSGKYNFARMKDKPFTFPVRCQSCDYCRLYRSKIWAARCTLEATQWPFNYFITLTYSDDYLPIIEAYSDRTGALEKRSNLVLKHLQSFFKMLRKNGYYFKYLAAGEYGSKTQRAHYHLVLFLNKPLDLKYRSLVDNSYMSYTSDLLSKIWKYGFHVINDFTPETAAYVAQYTLKKMPKKKHKQLSANSEFKQEFIVMSKSLGFNPILEKLDTIMKTGTISYSYGNRVFQLPLWRTALDKLENLGYNVIVEKLRNDYRAKAQYYNDIVIKKSVEQFNFEKYSLILSMKERMLRIEHNKI